MRYAILSDVHGRRERLRAVLEHARLRGAEQIVSLGDVGGDPCLALLRQAGAMAVFGNYEVSGWPRLQPEHRAWVQSWSPMLVEDGFLAVHAAPWWPEGLVTVEDFDGWLRRTRQPWRALFPYLSEDEEYLWRALAELESANVGHPARTILFHGHTHQQTVWQWTLAGHLRRVRRSSIPIEDDHRYLVGVGSVGMPEDLCWAAYALYDAEVGQIELIRLRRGS
jgi:predicted phosphodiesterase